MAVTNKLLEESTRFFKSELQPQLYLVGTNYWSKLDMLEIANCTVVFTLLRMAVPWVAT